MKRQRWVTLIMALSLVLSIFLPSGSMTVLAEKEIQYEELDENVDKAVMKLVELPIAIQSKLRNFPRDADYILLKLKEPATIPNKWKTYEFEMMGQKMVYMGPTLFQQFKDIRKETEADYYMKRQDYGVIEPFNEHSENYEYGVKVGFNGDDLETVLVRGPKTYVDQFDNPLEKPKYPDFVYTAMRMFMYGFKDEPYDYSDKAMSAHESGTKYIPELFNDTDSNIIIVDAGDYMMVSAFKDKIGGLWFIQKLATKNVADYDDLYRKFRKSYYVSRGSSGSIERVQLDPSMIWIEFK